MNNNNTGQRENLLFGHFLGLILNDSSFCCFNEKIYNFSAKCNHFNKKRNIKFVLSVQFIQFVIYPIIWKMKMCVYIYIYI